MANWFDQQFSMPAGRVAALVPDELEPLDELLGAPAEPAVLPAEPDGDAPTVPLLLVPPLLVLPEAIEPGAWFLILLVLTSQHWVFDPPGLGVVPWAWAATIPASIAAEASRARLRFMRVPVRCGPAFLPASVNVARGAIVPAADKNCRRRRNSNSSRNL
jgi:hypothetical protein